MEGLPLEQKNRLNSWAEQRDSLLREIGIYQTELNSLKTQVKEATDAFNDIQLRVSESRGVYQTVQEVEKRTLASLPFEIANLTIQKSQLETEIKGLEEKKVTLNDSITSLAQLMEKLAVLNNALSEKSLEIGKNLQSASTLAQKSGGELKEVFEEVKESAEKMAEKNKKNVEMTNIVLEKLPKYIFELQKPIPIRRGPYPGEIAPNRPKKQA